MSDPDEFVLYRIEAATVDGRPMPPGEAEFRIIGQLVAEPFTPASGGAAEVRFRIADWAGPYLPQDVVFEHRAVLVSDGIADRYGDVRGTYSSDGRTSGIRSRRATPASSRHHRPSGPRSTVSRATGRRLTFRTPSPRRMSGVEAATRARPA